MAKRRVPKRRVDDCIGSNVVRQWQELETLPPVNIKTTELCGKTHLGRSAFKMNVVVTFQVDGEEETQQC
jgi:hypothetical protein